MSSLGCLAQPVCRPTGSAYEDKPGNRHNLWTAISRGADESRLHSATFRSRHREFPRMECLPRDVFEGWYPRESQSFRSIPKIGMTRWSGVVPLCARNRPLPTSKKLRWSICRARSRELMSLLPQGSKKTDRWAAPLSVRPANRSGRTTWATKLRRFPCPTVGVAPGDRIPSGRRPRGRRQPERLKARSGSQALTYAEKSVTVHGEKMLRLISPPF